MLWLCTSSTVSNVINATFFSAHSARWSQVVEKLEAEYETVYEYENKDDYSGGDEDEVDVEVKVKVEVEVGGAAVTLEGSRENKQSASKPSVVDSSRGDDLDLLGMDE